MMRSSVDLPEPERPSSPTIYPSRSDRLASSRTSSSPCDLLKPRHTSLTRRISSPRRGGFGGVWIGAAVIAALGFCIALCLQFSRNAGPPELCTAPLWVRRERQSGARLVQPKLGFGV